MTAAVCKCISDSVTAVALFAFIAFCVWQCDGCDGHRITELERRVERLEGAK